MSTDTNDTGTATAQAAGLERYYRRVTIDLLNRIAVAFIIVGGIAVGIAAGSHKGRAIEAAILLSVGLALLWAFFVVMRFLGIQRRLGENPAAEVARLRAKPGRHQSRFFAGADLGHGAPVGLHSEDANPDAGDPYVEMRNVEGPGTDASPDGVNRTGDPSQGPIE